jgi:hypothetical protein
MDETVRSPSGGYAAFLETNRIACLKPQKVSGYSGYTSNALIKIGPLFSSDYHQALKLEVLTLQAK